VHPRAAAASKSTRGLVDDLLAGDKRAGAKLISLIEDDEPEASAALALIYPHTGRAQYVGFTGSPGVGKSSLINRLVREFRSRGKRVGVVAVDPTSPYSGGAVLGDRIRMADTGIDPGVFIRSMATRGHAGGLALATFDAVRVLDAMGLDLVFVETVGAGQSEVEIASRAHTTVVVEMPLTGDAIQTMKAGILEIGDVYVVNKTDLGSWETLVANLQFQIGERDGWRPPVVTTSALEDRGIVELADALVAHAAFLSSSGRLHGRNLERAKHEILENVQRILAQRVNQVTPLGAAFDRLAESVATQKIDPQTAAKSLFEDAVRTDRRPEGRPARRKARARP
jgi:LAO/AO transport system kinase